MGSERVVLEEGLIRGTVGGGAEGDRSAEKRAAVWIEQARLAPTPLDVVIVGSTL